jgi:hypothetical protein
MSEITAVGYFMNGLKKEWGAHCIKHNDSTIGIPDISTHLLRHGTQWVEVKATMKWPARDATKLHWEHYTEEQALFLKRREGWLFVRVAREYFLFNAQEAWAMWECAGFNKQEFIARSIAHWKMKVDFKHLGAIIWAL